MVFGLEVQIKNNGIDSRAETGFWNIWHPERFDVPVVLKGGAQRRPEDPLRNDDRDS
jgi:hypothetical protein